MGAVRDPERWRAALYIRLSREDESDGPSESVSNQRAMLEEFARKNGLTVCGEYIDDGCSGTTFDRPAFQRLLRDIEGKQVNLVLTKDLSRLGRDYILTGYYMERWFPEHRVRYISLLDGVDTGEERSANDITPFRAIMNDMYAKDISKKISSVKHDQQRRGLFIGGKAVFGYRMHPTEKNRIVPDPGAAPVVRHIFALALEGASCREIARRLNAGGVPTPAVYAGLTVARPGPCTGLWSPERVSDLLRNETYAGNLVQGRRVKVSYKSKKSIRRPPEEWVVVENTHQPLVDRDTFDRVQALLRSRRRTRSRQYDFPLKGLIFCRECGAPLGVINRPNAAGEDVLYFICRTYQRHTGAGACTSHTARESRVMQAVLEALEQLWGAWMEGENLCGEALRVLRGTSGGDAGAERRALTARIGALTARLDRMYLDQLEGTLEREDYLRLSARAREERAGLEGQLARLERRPADEGAVARELARRFAAQAPGDRAVLVSLVDRAELTQDRKVLLKVRFRPPRREAEADRLQQPRPEVSRIEKKALCKLEQAMNEK